MLGAVLAALGPIFAQVAKSLFPDPSDELKRLELQSRLQQTALAHAADLERAASEIVKAEAAGESALQRNWRPILMLTFGTLIVARWLGFVAPNLTEAEYLKLWSIIELGLGGYVIGRSAEKIAPAIASAIAKR